MRAVAPDNAPTFGNSPEDGLLHPCFNITKVLLSLPAFPNTSFSLFAKIYFPSSCQTSQIGRNRARPADDDPTSLNSRSGESFVGSVQVRIHLHASVRYANHCVTKFEGNELVESSVQSLSRQTSTMAAHMWQKDGGIQKNTLEERLFEWYGLTSM